MIWSVTLLELCLRYVSVFLCVHELVLPRQRGRFESVFVKEILSMHECVNTSFYTKKKLEREQERGEKKLVRWNLKKVMRRQLRKKKQNATLMSFLSRAIERATKKSCVKEE